MLVLFISLLSLCAHSQMGTDESFQCLEEFNCNNQGTNCQSFSPQKRFRCCGLVANGSEVCTEAVEHNQYPGVNADWSKHGDSYHLCTNSALEAMGLDRNGNPRDTHVVLKDLCCGDIEAFTITPQGQFNTFNSYLPCSPCSSFIVWPFPTFDSMNSSLKYPASRNQADEVQMANPDGSDNFYYADWVTFNESWRADFKKQPQHRNEYYPGGFMHAKLREYNKPPVCVYLPNSGGKMIEIKAEPEAPGNRLCVSDLKDDFTNKDSSGQTTTCDDSQLRTCFSEASTESENPPDFAFYIYCDGEGCEDSDVDFWLRARHNERKLSDVEDDTALDNPEMYCQYILDEYPEWDIYPSDITPLIDERQQPRYDGSVSAFSFFAVFVLGFLQA